MRGLVPQAHLTYVAAAIEGITLDGRELFLETGGEGSLLVLDHSAYPVAFDFPEGWTPPLLAADRVAWLCRFFWEMTLNGHELEVELEQEGEEEWLYLKEVFGNKQSNYWIVQFARGWQPPQLPRGVSGRQLPLPADCEREQLVALLSALYGMTGDYLVDLSSQQLVPLVNLACDVPGICVRQCWMKRQPRDWRQRLRWLLLGAPMAWRFEVQALAAPAWQYAVLDSLEEARRAAWETNRQLGAPTAPLVMTRENVEAVTRQVHGFLERRYFTVVEKNPLYPLPRAWRHRRLHLRATERFPVLYEESRLYLQGRLAIFMLIFDVSVLYDFPVIDEADETSFPRTLVTLEAERLTLCVQRRQGQDRVIERTTVFVREGAIGLSAGDADEWGIYHGE